MAQKRSTKAGPKLPSKEFEAEHGRISNALSDIVGGLAGQGTQLSQADTLQKNMRWYLVSNLRQLLSESYSEIGLIQTIIDVPVDDGMRGGLDIKSKQLSPEDVDDLQDKIEREGDLTEMGQALKWNRLYGGSGILIMSEDDFSTEFKPEMIKKGQKLQFRAVDMWELFYDKQSAETMLPEAGVVKVEFYNYYGKKVHHSRVMTMKGIQAPSYIRPRLRGWGLSVIEPLVRSINQYLKATDLCFEVLDEFKLDIYKIKGFTQSLMSDAGTNAVQKRIALANQQKNYQNAIAMDSEDDFTNKELTFAGLAETMVGIRQQVASDMRMPLTKIFGISAAGFSSGEDDIENYNAMVESSIRAKAKFHILQMVEMRCQEMFGHIPDDLSIEFRPLRILSAEQEENVKSQKFNRLLSAKTSGLIDDKEFRDACNKDNLLPVQLKAGKKIIKEEDADKEAGGNEVKETAPVSTKRQAPEAPEAE